MAKKVPQKSTENIYSHVLTYHGITGRYLRAFQLQTATRVRSMQSFHQGTGPVQKGMNMIKEIKERMTARYDALVETVKVALLLAVFAFLIAIS